MAKRADAEDNGKGIGKLPDGHYTLDGAVWHTPKTGAPTRCEIPGCDLP